MIRYLDVDTVVEINARRGGAGAGVRDRNLISAAVARPQQGFGDVEVFPTLWAKAAALFHGLCTTQGFQDGNKRTAWQATYAFLRANGWMLRGSTVAAETFALATAARLIDEAKVAEWLRDHSAAMLTRKDRRELNTPGGWLPGGLPQSVPEAASTVFESEGPEIRVFALRQTPDPVNLHVADEDRELELLAGFSMRVDDFVRVFGGQVRMQDPEGFPLPGGWPLPGVVETLKASDEEVAQTLAVDGGGYLERWWLNAHGRWGAFQARDEPSPEYVRLRERLAPGAPG